MAAKIQAQIDDELKSFGFAVCNVITKSAILSKNSKVEASIASGARIMDNILQGENFRFKKVLR